MSEQTPEAAPAAEVNVNVEQPANEETPEQEAPAEDSSDE